MHKGKQGCGKREERLCATRVARDVNAVWGLRMARPVDDSVYSERKLDLDEYESSIAPRRKRQMACPKYNVREPGSKGACNEDP